LEEANVLFRWWRSGWPWAWAGLIAIGLTAYLVCWQQRRASRLIAEAESKGRQDEHARLASDLHDSVNNLSQIRLLVGQLQVMLQPHKLPAEIAAQSHKISTAVGEAVGSLEDIVWAVKAENDNLANLAARLREKFGKFMELNAQVRCTLEFPPDVPGLLVSSTFNSHLLRVVSESLNNIVKHSNATEVSLCMALEGERLRITVADNGCGLPEDCPQGPDHGLSHMQTRIRELGGTCQITSAAGQGTNVAVTVPLPR
jgi:two-component system nitrate/nitrite sensor histidine kinase NarX